MRRAAHSVTLHTPHLWHAARGLHRLSLNVCLSMLVCARAARKKKGLHSNFSWIFNRPVVLH